MTTEKLTHEDFLKLVAGKQGVSTDARVREDCPNRDGYILRGWAYLFKKYLIIFTTRC